MRACLAFLRVGYLDKKSGIVELMLMSIVIKIFFFIFIERRGGLK